MFKKIIIEYIKNIFILLISGSIFKFITKNKFNNLIEEILKKYFISFDSINIFFYSNIPIIIDFILIYFLIIKNKDFNINFIELKENFMKLNILKIKKADNLKDEELKEINNANIKIKDITKCFNYYIIKKSNYMSSYIKFVNYYNICLMIFWTSIVFILQYNNANLPVLNNILGILNVIFLIFQIRNLRIVLIGIVYEVNYKNLRKICLIILYFLEFKFSTNLLFLIIINKKEDLNILYLYFYAIFVISILYYVPKINYFSEILKIYIKRISNINI